LSKNENNMLKILVTIYIFYFCFDIYTFLNAHALIFYQKSRTKN
jgi:hypothetical protein